MSLNTRKNPVHILTTTKQKLKSKHAIYGICHKCQSSIEIPGLEAFKCSGECGWVKRRAARTIDLHRPVQSITVNVAPAHKTEVTLLDLVAGGAK